MSDVSWRKSSFSGAGNDCVEVGWRKSTYSGGTRDCVELAYAGGEENDRLVRDTKHRAGGVIHVTQRGWTALRASLTRVGA